MITLFLSGCVAEKETQEDNEANTSFMGKPNLKSEYGFRKMCERSFRREEKNIFCSKENLCREIEKRVTLDKNNSPVAGMVEDIQFVKEFCR